MAEENQYYIDNREVFDNLPPVPTTEPTGESEDEGKLEVYKISYNTNEVEFLDSETSLIDMRKTENIITLDLRSVIYKPEPFSELIDIGIKSY